MSERLIPLGVIGRAHGVRGHVRVTSFTEDPADLTSYGPLTDERGRWFALSWVGDGVVEVAEMVGRQRVKIADRTAAERLTNTKLFVERNKLPPPEDDEYYLTDLIGLAAIGPDGAPLGVIATVHDYGAGTSLEIARATGGSTIVPFTAACVPTVDIAAGRVVVVPPDEIDVPETKAAGVALEPEPEQIASPDARAAGRGTVRDSNGLSETKAAAA